MQEQLLGVPSIVQDAVCERPAVCDGVMAPQLFTTIYADPPPSSA